MAVERHEHTGLDSPKIHLKNIYKNESELKFLFSGIFFETISDVPTDTPTNLLDQVKIYISGGTILLYVYDTTNSTWRRFNYYTP